MTWTIATSTLTLDHDGVYTNGRVKIAQTPRKKWRMWVQAESGRWVMHSKPFRRLTDAQEAAERLFDGLDAN